MECFSLEDKLVIRGVYTLLYQEKNTEFIFPGETHDFWELIYMDKGFAYLLIDDHGYKINQGELFLFGKNQNHIVWSDSKVAPCFLTLSFDMDFYDEKYFEFKRFIVNNELKDIIKKVIIERLNLFEGNINSEIHMKRQDVAVGAEQLIKLYITEFLLKLHRQGGGLNHNDIQSSLVRQKSENMIFKHCVEYIEDHINEKLYVEHVSENVHISTSYLTRIFKSNSGISVMEYILNLKLEKAKGLMRESVHNITEISDMLGFSSIHYFSRAFKKRYNISPREYSKSLQSMV